MDKTTIIDLVNEQRSMNGLPELRTDSKLQLAADLKTAEMKEQEYFAHYNKDMESIAGFLPEGYVFRILGENLAFGYADEAALVKAWMASRSHKDNILYPEYRDTAVSVLEAGDSYLVTQVFALEQSDYLAQVQLVKNETINKSSAFLQSTFYFSASVFILLIAVLIFRKAAQRA